MSWLDVLIYISGYMVDSIISMDSLTLSLLVFIFFCAMVVYFLTAQYAPAPHPPPQALHQNNFAPAMPAILKHNIAVARLMRIEHNKGRALL